MPQPRWIVVCLVLSICLCFGHGWIANAAENSQSTISGYEVTHLSAQELNNWLTNRKVAFVELYLPTCPSCKKAAPVLEKLAREMQLHLAFIDCSQPANYALAEKLQVKYVPTLITYINGQPQPNPKVGFIGEPAYRKLFGDTLAAYGKSN